MSAPTVAERFARLCERLDNGCVQWRGRTDRLGYGRFTINRRQVMAHRAAWLLHRGEEVPAGLELDHLCRNRGCVNPDHLEPVTHRENMARCPSPPWKEQRERTHCPQRHAYTPENTRVAGNRRHCRACDADRARRARAAARAAA